MSKTYRKNVRANNACGDNREFYKNRRSKFKHTSKQDFRNLLANHDIDFRLNFEHCKIRHIISINQIIIICF